MNFLQPPLTRLLKLSKRQAQSQPTINTNNNNNQQSFSCQIYLAPSQNQIIQAYDQTVLKWDPNCLGADPTIDIYLQSIDAAQPIHVWKSVITSSAQLDTQLIPDWWNSSQSATLQLVITGSDQPAWAGRGPGPVFYANFNGSQPLSPPPNSQKSHSSSVGGLSVEFINNLYHHAHGITGGKLGAAIFFPLLAVALAIAAYVFISRRRSGEASKRWSQYVDQRMSAIGSLNWDPATPLPPPSLRGVPSSRAASIYRHSVSLPPRQSFASSPNRISTAYSHNPRISSYSLAQPRPNTVYSRQSRVVSFADDHSGTRSHKSSLSINSSSPRLPAASATDLALSPSQQHGPELLGPIATPFRAGHLHKSSVARSASNLRFEIDDDPAPPSDGDHQKPSGKSSPTNTTNSTNSTKGALKIDTAQVGLDRSLSSLGSGSASGMRRLAVRTSILSPDEALRQYTLSRERGPENNPSAPASSRTVPVGITGGHEMKVLYDTNPTQSVSIPAPAPERLSVGHAQRVGLQSVYTVASRYSDASHLNDSKVVPRVPVPELSVSEALNADASRANK